MPKVNGIKKYITEFGEEVFSTDGDILFCKIYSVKVNSVKRFTVTQHLKTSKHERLLNCKQNFKTQQLFTPSTSSNSKKSRIFQKIYFKLWYVLICLYIKSPILNFDHF